MHEHTYLKLNKLGFQFMKTFRKYWKMEAKSIQKTPLSFSWAVSTSYLTALPGAAKTSTQTQKQRRAPRTPTSERVHLSQRKQASKHDPRDEHSNNRYTTTA